VKTEQTEEFYETLQDQIDKISKNDYIVVAGDYNARVGNIPIDGILGTNGEITTNSNGHKLKEYATVNKLKIMKTFCTHKEIHKMTWNAQGYRSIIDYILTNKKLSPLVNLMHSPCSLNIDIEWQTLKNTLQQAANEALGKRKKKKHKWRLMLWNEDIKNLIENKKKPYL